MNMCHEEGIIPLKQTHIAKTGVCVKKYFFSLNSHVSLKHAWHFLFENLFWGTLMLIKLSFFPTVTQR